MKKLFAVLLALGLIVAFSATASAVDVKFSGSYYVVGVYDDNPSLAENAYSRAYFYQRIRIMPVFTIAEGLTFTARMDAMEGAWDTSTAIGGRAARASGDRNFDWERGWVTFKTGIGQFDAGFMSGGAWGTLWADSEGVRARIKYTGKFGPVLLIAIFEQNTEGNTVAAPHYVDADSSAYYLAPIYMFKGGSAGILYGYINAATPRPAANYKIAKQILYPYMKATFGPVYVEAEVNYIFGENDYDYPHTAVDYKGWGAYLMAKTNMGPASIGAQVGWSKGEDTDADVTVGPGKGADWNPALMLFNDELNTWSGGDINTNAGGGANSNINDGYLIFNVFADYKVTPKFSLGSALTWAKADKAQIAEQDKEYGVEFDVTATFKIYDNLSYMVGAGYLWTGDWFKKGVAGATVENDYILMNKLTLNF